MSAKARAAGGLVVFIQHESSSGYLEFGTDAWQLARGLHIEVPDIRIRKTTPDSFHRTDLEPVLKKHGVTERNRHLSAAQVIQHHNETLANISSSGPRVRVVSAEALRVEA